MSEQCEICGCGMIKDKIPSGLSSITFWDKQIFLCNMHKILVRDAMFEFLEELKK